MDTLMRGGDKAFEKWMRLVGFAVKFGMELAGDEEGVLCQFDNLDQFAIGRVAAETKVGFFELFAVGVVEFVAVPMAFVHDKGAVEAGGFGPNDELAGLSAQAH